MGNKVRLRNVEGAAVALLQDAVAAEVGTGVPNPRPATLVRVQRVGGAQINMVQERPILLVECWGPSRLAAWTLAQQCHSLFAGRDSLEANGIELMDRSLTSPVNYPDPSTASPRYQFQLTTTVNLEGPLP